MSDLANDTDQIFPARAQVGGFLLYLCVVMTFLGPLKMLPLILANSSAVLSGFYGLMTASSVMAGLAMWGRAGATFLLLKVQFVMRLIYGIIQIYFGFAMLERKQSSGQGELELFYAALNILMVILLALYFRTSRRVNETFGRNL